MTTIRELTIQFNQPVVTPEGNGYLVAADYKGNLLISMAGTRRHQWFKKEQVHDWSLEKDGKFNETRKAETPTTYAQSPSQALPQV